MTLEITAPLVADREHLELPVKGGPWPVQGAWTYEDYLRLPDDGHRYEIIAGALYVTAAPRFNHQYTVGELFAALHAHVRHHQMGVVLPAPFEVHLPDIAQPVQPDVVFILAEQQPPPEARFYEGVPGLVIEVLSPSTARTDRMVKFWAYERAGVPEYWIVDPRTGLVEVYVLREGIYALHGQYTGEDVVSSPTLPDLALSAQDLFPSY